MIEDTKLLGYHVPAGTRILINVWAIGRDPATRELGQRDFTFLPFGAGRRGCPGVGFGRPNVELVLASLLYHFDWEIPAGRASTIDTNEQGGMAVRLKKTLHLVALPWSPS
ncbi:unnamed protein product [Urochloa humidicola]